MADPLDQLRIDRTKADRESPWPRRALLLGLSVVLVGAAAFWFLSGAQATTVETVTVREVPAGAASGTVLDASGYVVARRQATVSSKITGRLVEVSIEEGMSVKEGQVLARLDDANARRALGLAEARQVAAETALKEIQVRLRDAEITTRPAARPPRGRKNAEPTGEPSAIESFGTVIVIMLALNYDKTTIDVTPEADTISGGGSVARCPCRCRGTETRSRASSSVRRLSRSPVLARARPRRPDPRPRHVQPAATSRELL